MSLKILFLCLGQASTLLPGHAELTGERFTELTRAPAPEPELAWAQSRELRLTLEDTGIALVGKWVFQGHGAAKERYFLGTLLPASARIEAATWNGAPASLWTTDGTVTVAGQVGARAVLEVRAFVPTSGSERELAVLGATRGTVELVPAAAAPTPPAPGVRAATPPTLELTAGDGTPVLPQGPRFSTGASELRIAARRAPLTDEGAVVVGRAAMGLTIGDDVVTGFARVGWVVRRGTVDRVALIARDVGVDLDVSGMNVARTTRHGDRVEIELKAPSSEVVWVTSSWTTPVPAGNEGSVPIPTLAPEGALDTESTVELARSGEVDAIPNMAGFATIASQQLPAWGVGLTRGTPTAAFRHSGAPPGGSRLDLFRFEPVSGPEVVIEVADVTVSVTADGRSLLLARYELTNERADALELTPPRGARLAGAWVVGQPVSVAELGGKLRIPLLRSIETAEGLLSFPVTVAFVGESTPWRRREERRFALPRVHAPISVTRATLRLPRDYHSRLEPGEDPGVVAAFTPTTEVAYGLDDADLVATADVIYRDAIDAWNRNDFGRASQRLGELEQLGAKSENQEGMEANVEILLTGPLAGAPAVSKSRRGSTDRDQKERRIREQAKARSGDSAARQRAHKQKAKALRAAGDYEAAQAEYEQALAETETLRNLDAEENVYYEFEAKALETEAAAAAAEADARDQLEHQSKLWSGGPFSLPPPRRPAPPLFALAPLVVPTAGEAVRYEYTLLESGAQRELPIRAKQRPSRYGRKAPSR